MIFPNRSDQVTVFALFGQFVHCYGVRVNLSDAEIAGHTARLSEGHPHLRITTELVLDHRVFIARGKNGQSPWIVLSSDLERFEAAIAPCDVRHPAATGHTYPAGTRRD
ncbi:MAG: hypothetical protein QOG05_3159 [Streptosporangiaceae bacterium]|jgi:hypothetical protein|nr:hypothetical protein [Streptosporangiaceae bacterium]